MFASLDFVAQLCNFEKIAVLECVTYFVISTYNSDGQTLSRSNFGLKRVIPTALCFCVEWYGMLWFCLFTFCYIYSAITSYMHIDVHRYAATLVLNGYRIFILNIVIPNLKLTCVLAYKLILLSRYVLRCRSS